MIGLYTRVAWYVLEGSLHDKFELMPILVILEPKPAFKTSGNKR